MPGSLTVTGNLTVNGTTQTTNSTTVTVDDPIITLGGDTSPESDDDKDRGVEFRWHNGSSAKVGFFGYDDSAEVFTFIPDATNSSEVFSGVPGAIKAGVYETSDDTGTISKTTVYRGTTSVTDLASPIVASAANPDSAEYTIFLSNGTDSYTSKLLVLMNGSAPITTEYGILQTSSSFGASIVVTGTTSVYITVSGTTTATQCRISRTVLSI